MYIISLAQKTKDDTWNMIVNPKILPVNPIPKPIPRSKRVERYSMVETNLLFSLCCVTCLFLFCLDKLFLSFDLLFLCPWSMEDFCSVSCMAPISINNIINKTQNQQGVIRRWMTDPRLGWALPEATTFQVPWVVGIPFVFSSSGIFLDRIKRGFFRVSHIHLVRSKTNNYSTN